MLRPAPTAADAAESSNEDEPILKPKKKPAAKPKEPPTPKPKPKKKPEPTPPTPRAPGTPRTRQAVREEGAGALLLPAPPGGPASIPDAPAEASRVAEGPPAEAATEEEESPRRKLTRRQKGKDKVGEAEPEPEPEPVERESAGTLLRLSQAGEGVTERGEGTEPVPEALRGLREAEREERLKQYSFWLDPLSRGPGYGDDEDEWLQAVMIEVGPIWLAKFDEPGLSRREYGPLEAARAVRFWWTWKGPGELAQLYGGPSLRLLQAQVQLQQCLRWAQHAADQGQDLPAELRQALRDAAHRLFRIYGAEPPSASGFPTKQPGLEEPSDE